MTAVSVIIKALNEEAKIAKAIESALRAISNVGGEVILADALSDDRTVEIARSFPITIVQLVHVADRGCGSGPQLGFQHAQGDFVYLMDGDMELQPGFIEAGLSALESEHDLAGVGGLLEYPQDPAIEYRARQLRRKADEAPGYVNHLSCGGLYRTQTIRRMGYVSNRNLHSFEELELGLRLGAAGWKLKRIDKLSVHHHTHSLGAYTLLAKKLRAGFGFGAGELLRSALGKSYLPYLLKEFSNLFIIGCWMVMLVVVLLAPITLPLRLALLIALLAAPVIAVSVRRRSVQIGLYTVAGLSLVLVAAVRGALRRQVDPLKPIESQVLQRGEWIYPLPAKAARCQGSKWIRG
jgi:glycosyltransferase involved in cell wall biosynthesis